MWWCDKAETLLHAVADHFPKAARLGIFFFFSPPTPHPFASDYNLKKQHIYAFYPFIVTFSVTRTTCYFLLSLINNF